MGVFSAAGLCRGFAQLFGHLLSLFLIHFLLFLINALYTRPLHLMTAPACMRVSEHMLGALAQFLDSPAPLIAGNLGLLCFTCHYLLRDYVKQCEMTYSWLYSSFEVCVPEVRSCARVAAPSLKAWPRLHLGLVGAWRTRGAWA